ncbi:MAG TPA: hypothetical protein VKB88_31600 [Bryobacteraceae bacterium]|nr:hypothetical protein [Bryobacteraceae bacterium]
MRERFDRRNAQEPDNVSMPVRNIAPLICMVLHLGFCQDPARVSVEGIGGKPDFAASSSDLALFQQRTITTIDHGTAVTFQGVLLTDLLARVAIPTGEKFHSTAASYYLVAEGRDGHRAVFAWTELDPSFANKAVYVVTKRDGRPLSDNEGPFELVVPAEKGGARWVRQLSALRIEPNATPYGSEQARWIRENLAELRSIKVGMTRGGLLKVFMQEGGTSTRTWHRYVYRKCAYVKVDVEFAPAGNDTSGNERLEDRITKISKPYLELTVLD